MVSPIRLWPGKINKGGIFDSDQTLELGLLIKLIQSPGDSGPDRVIVSDDHTFAFFQEFQRHPGIIKGLSLIHI